MAKDNTKNNPEETLKDPAKDVAVADKASVPMVLSAEEQELLADAAEFKQEYTRDEIVVPFLRILQGNSPQLKPGGADYVEGAVQGMFFNTATREVYNSSKDKLLVVPVAHVHEFVEWVPKTAGGGYVAAYSVGEGSRIVTAKEGSMDIILPNSPLGTPGNQLQETITYTCLLINPEKQTASPVLVSFASTAFQTARRWNAAHFNRRIVLSNGQSVQPPMFRNVARLTAKIKSNDVNSWYVPDIEDAGDLITDYEAFGRAVYAEAKAAAQSIKDSGAKGFNDAMEADKAATTAHSTTAPAATGQTVSNDPLDDEIPF